MIEVPKLTADITPVAEPAAATPPLLLYQVPPAILLVRLSDWVSHIFVWPVIVAKGNTVMVVVTYTELGRV
jgi:hypothetical protein